jgi:hypothetical protein
MLRAVTLALVSQVVLGQSVTNVYSIDIGEPLYPEGISFSRTSDRVTLTSCVTGMFVQLSASMDMSLIQLYKYETNHTWGLGVHGDPDDSSIFWTVENVAVTGLEGTRVAAYQLHEASDTASAYAEYLVGHALDVDSQRLLLNDFTFDPSGNLFITDSFKSSVEKLAGAAPSAGTAGDLSTLTSGDELGSTEGTFNSNGIVYVEHTDGDFLLVAVAALGKLVKVNVATGAQSEVSVTGGSLAGGDGMVLLPDGRLVVVASGYVQLVKSTASDWNNATVQYAVDVSSYEGESATTAALADTDVSVFVTFVRFGDIFADVSGATMNASTLVRVEFPEDVEESTTESTTESNTDDTDSSLSVRTSVIFTFAAALKTVGM